MKKIIVPVLCLLIPLAHASEIYKCAEADRTVYSDVPCSPSAETMDVSEAIKPTGAQLSNEASRQLGEQMGRDRKVRSLERAIASQEKNIAVILEDYNTERDRLDRALEAHKNNKDRDGWSGHPYKRERYYEEKRKLEGAIKSLKRDFRAQREIAYNKLYSLQRERSQLEGQVSE